MVSTKKLGQPAWRTLASTSASPDRFRDRLARKDFCTRERVRSKEVTPQMFNPYVSQDVWQHQLNISQSIRTGHMNKLIGEQPIYVNPINKNPEPIQFCHSPNNKFRRRRINVQSQKIKLYPQSSSYVMADLPKDELAFMSSFQGAKVLPSRVGARLDPMLI